MKKIIILGSTGSIGKQTLEIIKKDKKNFRVILLSTDKNIKLISKQIKTFDVKNVVVTNKKKYEILKKKFKKIKGPIPLPTKIERYTVLRSPHIDKKSREQFETRTHKRLIDIIEPTPQTVEALMKLDLASGVDVEIKI